MDQMGSTCHTPPRPTVAEGKGRHRGDVCGYESVQTAGVRGSMRSKPVHTEPVRAEPVHTEPVRAEPVHTEPVHTEHANAEPVHAESVNPQPSEASPVVVIVVASGVEQAGIWVITKLDGASNYFRRGPCSLRCGGRCAATCVGRRTTCGCIRRTMERHTTHMPTQQLHDPELKLAMHAMQERVLTLMKKQENGWHGTHAARAFVHAKRKAGCDTSQTPLKWEELILDANA
eukprot:363564-Chlamydomonas_euryale.AAC.7